MHPYILASRDLKILKLGGEVKIEKPAVGCIKIGLGECGIVDHKYKRSIWQNSGTVIFGGRAQLGVGMRVSNSGVLRIGDHCHFNANSDIICQKEICFGDECLVSWECLIMDTDFHSITDAASGEVVNPDRKIEFGRHVWLGSRCTVLKGSSIADDSVIASCSLVTGKLEQAGCVYASDRIIRQDISWLS